MSDDLRRLVEGAASGGQPASFDATDAGLAQEFVNRYGESFRHIEERKTGQGEWLYFDGVSWRPGSEAEVERHIERMGTDLMHEAVERENDALHKFGKRARSTAGIGSIRKRVEVHKDIAATREEFDTHPHLLQVANGVVDLRTGALEPPDPGLMLTKRCPQPFDPSAEAPTWRRVLDECLGPEAAESFESDLGYMLTGETREHVFWVLYGPTSRNGKSLICEALARVFGFELVVSVSPGSFLLGSRPDDGRQARGDVARLRAARFAMTSEIPEAARLDEDLVKRLTGGDTIVARHLYAREEEFMNSASIVMRTNNFPGLDPDSPAIWNRVRLVEFPNSFAGREDKTLPERLDAEATGILARLVRRSIAYYERGTLAPNPSGDERLAEIKASVDYIGDVLERRFERVPDGATPKAEVKAIIEDECRRAGVPSPTASRGFDERMARKGFPPSNKKVNSVTTRVYLGLVPRGGGEGSDLLSRL